MIATCTIDVPSSAAPGESVAVPITVRNVDTVTRLFRVQIYRDDVLIYTDTDRSLAAGVGRVYTYTFDMPDKNTEIFVWVEYWTGAWSYAVAATATITPSLPPATGQITKVRINKSPEGTELALPATVAADNNSFEARIWLENTSSAAYGVTGWAITTDPNGTISVSAGKRLTVYPGSSAAREFTLQCPKVNASGNWYLAAEFKLDDGTMVTTLPKTLCLTAPKKTGEIISVLMHKESEGTAITPGVGTAVAANGESFEVRAQFKNTSSLAYTCSCHVKVIDPNGTIHISTNSPHTAGPNAGQTLLFGPFNCPKVMLPGVWNLEVVFNLDINGEELARWGPAPCFTAAGVAGAIVDKWVNWGSETRMPMPASVLADLQTFEVGVKWESRYVEGFDVKVEISVKYPDGTTARFIESTWYGMSPGEVHEKNFNVVAVDRGGEWPITIRLITREGEEIDRFDGICLDAQGAQGSITSMWFNKGSLSKAPFSTPVLVDNQNFEVGMRYTNLSDWTIIAGVRVEVWDPDGLKQPTPAVDYTGIAPNEELGVEYQFGSVDKVGEWEVKLTFITRDDGLTLVEWPSTGNGILFDAQPIAEFSELHILSFGKVTAAALTPITVKPGDTIAVDVSFQYTTPSPTKVQLGASLWIPPGVDYTVPAGVELATGTNQTWTGTIDIPITDSEAIGLKNRTYDLMVTIEGYGIKDQIDNAVTCEGMPEGILGGIGAIGEMIGMLVLVMVVMMMMNMMQGFTGQIGGPERVGEAAAGWVRGKGAQAGEWVRERISPVEIHIYDKD